MILRLLVNCIGQAPCRITCTSRDMVRSYFMFLITNIAFEQRKKSAYKDNILGTKVNWRLLFDAKSRLKMQYRNM